MLVEVQRKVTEIDNLIFLNKYYRTVVLGKIVEFSWGLS